MNLPHIRVNKSSVTYLIIAFHVNVHVSSLEMEATSFKISIPKEHPRTFTQIFEKVWKEQMSHRYFCFCDVVYFPMK